MAPPIFNFIKDGGEWSTSGPDRFTPGNERRYPLNGRVVVPCRAELDVLKKRKISSSAGIRTPYRPPRGLFAISTTLSLLSLSVYRYLKLKIMLRKKDVKNGFFNGGRVDKSAIISKLNSVDTEYHDFSLASDL
jgi:hypothetical protein